MDGIKSTALVVTLCIFLASQCAGLCHDLDEKACQTMTSQDQHFCKDSPMASTVCPKFCKKCPLICYHCDNTVHNYTDCSSTRECQVGEQCLLHQLVSSTDGHREYKMNCASPYTCDGMGFMQTGRRDINTRNLITQCCTDDLCNNPGYYKTTTIKQTTTTKQTTTLKQTTTPKQTTTAPKQTVTTLKQTLATSTKTPLSLTVPHVSNCNKDIEFMIEDSRHTSHLDVRNYLRDIVKHLDIGVQHAMVGVALYDHGVDDRITLGNHPQKSELLYAIHHIRFEADDNDIDKGDVLEFLHDELHGRHGDRPNFENVVVIMVDHFSRLFTARFLNDVDRLAGISSLSKDIIVINVGANGAYSPFSSLASDSSHVIDVPSYSDLSTTLKSVLDLICT